MSTLTATTSPSVFGGQVIEPGLRGRRRECEVLDLLVAGTRSGQGGALMLRGAPGVGKTALLEYLLRRASGCQVAQVLGREAEMGLTFAGLHQLCEPMLDRLDRLPGPQREALGTALGLCSAPAPDFFLVGLSVLRLLSEVAKERPLVCVVDDAQWLDLATARVLEFAARRLGTGPVAVVFAVRQCHNEQDLKGLPGLVVQSLAAQDARALLESSVTGPLDEQVRDRIVAETRGKPLMLLEMARQLAPEELAGGFGVPDAVDVPAPLEEHFGRKLEMLPSATRWALLVAAAEPVLDPVVVREAAHRLGIELEAAAPAAAVGLVEFDGQVRFRHPLARAAVYRAASAAERRSVHRALAKATDPDVDPDRRAWHRAQAASGADEEVAAELESAADRAQARGGLVALAAFHERAALLTPEPGRRAARALLAAHTKHLVGASDVALRLLAMAQVGPLDELGHARAEKLRAQIAADSGHPHDSVPLLLEAAKRLEPLHLGLARESYRDAFHAALTAGPLARHAGLRDVGEAVLAAGARTSQPPLRAGDLLLDGLATVSTQGYAMGAPILKRALAEFGARRALTEEGLRWLPLACGVSHDVWDDESLYTLSTSLVELARQTGALAMLPVALCFGAELRLLVGELATAVSMAGQAEALARATGSPMGLYSLLVLAAWRGREPEVSRLMASVTTQMVRRGEGRWLTAVHWATAVLNNGLCRYDAALIAAERGSEYPDEMGLATWSMVELVEAAARTGQAGRAAAVLEPLSVATRASGTNWALGVAARSQALLEEGERAEHLHQEAVERLGRTRIRVDLARAHLVYGEWLRRQNRRVDARQQLRTAHDMLTTMGIDGFAERARRELLATGETVRKRNVETLGELTAQEAQIARLAAQGHTNPEIATCLFVSARTVEWHLRKVFSKLGVSSRRELRASLPTVEGVGPV